MTKQTAPLEFMPRGEAICRFALWCHHTGRSAAEQANRASYGRTSTIANLTDHEIGDLLGFVEMSGESATF